MVIQTYVAVRDVVEHWTILLNTLGVNLQEHANNVDSKCPYSAARMVVGTVGLAQAIQKRDQSKSMSACKYFPGNGLSVPVA